MCTRTSEGAHSRVVDAVGPGRDETADPGVGTRRRPFGVLVVALIQVATVAIALVGSLTALELPWEGVIATYVQEHAWARLLIMGIGVAVVVAVIGLWRMRYWGWALMVSIVGLSLLLDLVTWWRNGPETGLPSYVRMAMDVVCAFYLNTTAVQAAFRAPPVETTAPVVGRATDGPG